ncbi:V4R domain protein [uncultured archaeon]|nr:V4R domain protein [uncultured archaeon]
MKRGRKEIRKKGAVECSFCGYVAADASFNFCPVCGFNLSEYEGDEGVYSIERIRYLWERRNGGKLVYDNFRSVRDSGVYPHIKSKPIRPQLGDFGHVHLSNLMFFAPLHYSPKLASELYLISKLEGYYNVESGLRALKWGSLISAAQKGGMFWRFFESRKIKETFTEGWRSCGGGILSITKVDKRKKGVFFELRESDVSMLPATKKPACVMDGGVLAGSVEALFDGFWDCDEVACARDGKPACVFRVYRHETEDKPSFYMPKEEEVQRILDSIFDDVTSRRRLRKVVDDYVYLMVPQCDNYFWLSSSPGHTILSKHLGAVCGRQIAEKAGVKGVDLALDYIKDLFLFLKAGVITDIKKPDSERILIHMDESVYAAGVADINMKLCVFLAGIIEGILNAAGGNYEVTEKNCLAKGDEDCVFIAKKRKIVR